MDRKTLAEAEIVNRRLENAEARVRLAESPCFELLPGAWRGCIKPETEERVREIVLADLRAERDRIAAEFAAI